MVDHANRQARSYGGPSAPRAAESAPGKRTLVEAEAARAGGGGGAPLPAALQGKLEGALGGSLDHVRVHAEDAGARAMGARAYARGSELHFAPGEYDPDSQHGQALIGHELVHSQQQAQGRVATSVQGKGMALSHDAGLEAEADELGARMASGQRVDLGAVGPAPASGPVQRYLYLGTDGTDRVKHYEELPSAYQDEIAKHDKPGEVQAFVRARIKEEHLYLRAFTPQHLIEKYEAAAQQTPKVLGPGSFARGDKLYGLTNSYGGSHDETARDRHTKNLARQQATAQTGNTSNTIDGHLLGLKANVDGPLDIPSDGSERQRFGEFLQEHPEKHRETKEGEPVSGYEKRTTKVCKAGIEFFTSRENKVIHFELFGLDMKRTVTVGSSYTDSELRYIYRQYLKQLEGQAPDAKLENVKFYLDGNPMPAPWIAEPELWEKYKLARQQKQAVKASSKATTSPQDKQGSKNNNNNDDDDGGWVF